MGQYGSGIRFMFEEQSGLILVSSDFMPFFDKARNGRRHVDRDYQMKHGCSHHIGVATPPLDVLAYAGMIEAAHSSHYKDM
jgi:hypothetical protein